MIDETLLDEIYDCILTLNKCEWIVNENEYKILQQTQKILNKFLKENN